MHHLNDVLDHQIRQLDTVLLRLTTLRLLMAAGKHRMVAPTIDELESSFRHFEAAESASLQTLTESGYKSFDDVVAAAEPGDGGVLQRKIAAFRSLHRDVRVALASTGAAAESAVREAATALPADSIEVGRARGGHRFLTGDR